MDARVNTAEQRNGGTDRRDAEPLLRDGGPEQRDGGLDRRDGGLDRRDGGPDQRDGGPDRMQGFIAVLALVGIALYLVGNYGFHRLGYVAGIRVAELPLLAVLTLGGVPLVFVLLVKLLRREFGSDLLAGISIVTSVCLHEYLAGAYDNSRNVRQTCILAHSL